MNDKCSDCKHSYEPKEPELKVGDIAVYDGMSFKEILRITDIIEMDDNNSKIHFEDGSRSDSKYVRIASPDEALKYWEDKCTYEKNGMKFRLYEDVVSYIRIYWKKENGETDEMKVFLANIIPFKIHKGNYKYPE